MLMVRMVGIEPTLLEEPDSKSGASANSATPATTDSFSYSIQLYISTKFKSRQTILEGAFF